MTQHELKRISPNQTKTHKDTKIHKDIHVRYKVPAPGQIIKIETLLANCDKVPRYQNMLNVDEMSHYAEKVCVSKSPHVQTVTKLNI